MSADRDTNGFTRGGLIKTGAAAAVALGLGGAAARAVAGAGDADVAASGIAKPRGGAAHLRAATYAPLVGTHFKMRRQADRALRLKLIEAKTLRGPGEAFSLLFRGRRTLIEAGTYSFEHPALGTFDLFVGPVGRGVKGLDLEAVVNRIAV